MALAIPANSQSYRSIIYNGNIEVSDVDCKVRQFVEQRDPILICSRRIPWLGGIALNPGGTVAVAKHTGVMNCGVSSVSPPAGRGSDLSGSKKQVEELEPNASPSQNQIMTCLLGFIGTLILLNCLLATAKPNETEFSQFQIYNHVLTEKRCNCSPK
ncbi:hypothetical protein SUGI_0784360 [Cryptomeria japonica]|nr:hypothetical protein SUGI_0784360 [Cryptomeria japonica]